MTRLEGIYAGRIQLHYAGDRDSAIDKQPLESAVEILHEGIHCDQQADRINHGGLERALLHYCADHYAWWREQFPQRAERFQPPGFGENLSSSGMNESSVHIGDIYRIGSCTIQVTQPRTPCWKLNVRFDIPEMARLVQENGRCGWFYRILEPGDIAVGDAIEVLERLPDSPSVAVTLQAVYHDFDRERLQWLTQFKPLASNWRKKASDRLNGKRFSNSIKRLIGH